METIFTFIGGAAFGAFLMFHNRKPRDKYILNQIRELIIDNKIQLKKIMATQQELLALLAEANEATNEIANDIQALLSREPNISDETMAEAQALVDRLKGVASQYDEPTTEEPEEPVDPEQPTF